MKPGFAAAVWLATAMVSAGQAWGWGETALLGPLKTRNHHPLFTGLLHPAPEGVKIAVDTAWEAGINHSSVFAMGANRDFYIHMDKELTELDISFRTPVWQGRVEVGMEAAAFVSRGGFLDPLVRNYHSLIGVPGYDWQDHFPDNFYVDKLYLRQAIFRLGHQDRVEPGDATFWVKAPAWSRGEWSTSVQLFLQAPTGSAEAGVGSGFWEFGGRILAQVEYPGLGGYASLGVYFPGELKGMDGSIGLDPVVSAFLGFEWPLWNGWSFLAQLVGSSSPMPREPGEFFNQPWLDGEVGFKKAAGKGRVYGIGLSENLNQTAPDFTIHASFSM